MTVTCTFDYAEPNLPDVGLTVRDASGAVLVPRQLVPATGNNGTRYSATVDVGNASIIVEDWDAEDGQVTQQNYRVLSVPTTDLQPVLQVLAEVQGAGFDAATASLMALRAAVDEGSLPPSVAEDLADIKARFDAQPDGQIILTIAPGTASTLQGIGVTRNSSGVPIANKTVLFAMLLESPGAGNLFFGKISATSGSNGVLQATFVAGARYVALSASGQRLDGSDFTAQLANDDDEYFELPNLNFG